MASRYAAVNDFQGEKMTYLSWSDELAVGNTFIDNDHKKLIEMVNRLHALMNEGKGKDVIGKVLHNLITYTHEHFRREEDLMRKLQFPGFQNHKDEHEKLLAQVLDLQHKFESGAATLSIQVLHFLRDWLINHIGKSDKLLAAAAQG
ncbi:bacteriohemerythrin [Herbaspirillum sp. HC18]|nr:bacteriohemerythrin [Herbaspirillum sp. HC18]